MRGRYRFAALIAAALLTGPARADETTGDATSDLEQAARLLSAFPSGLVPARPDVGEAIATLAEHGTRTEISLLRSLATSESAEIRGPAAAAIEHIRERQRLQLRAAFARTIPASDALASAAEAHRRSGLASEEARCVAYADAVLGGTRIQIDAIAGLDHASAEDLLAAGMPRHALVAAMSDRRPEARRLEAQAREDLGDLAGALNDYAALAARGDQLARSELDSFGVDPERLLLGMMVRGEEGSLDPATDAATLDVLVRHGEELTATVLAERSLKGSLGVRAVATDALGRMLVGSGRTQPLSPRGRRIAQRALAETAKTGPEPLAIIAREALP